jgi:outer membrane immunogenic protein
MKKYVSVASRIAFAAYGAVLAPAAAADLGGYPNYPDKGRGQGIYVPSYFSWTGAYVGGNLGYAYGNSTTTADTAGAFNNAYSSMEIRPYGWMAGLDAGYNWQSDTFIFGVEGDLGYLGADREKYRSDGFATVSYGWYGTATARIGFSDSRWMIYGKGGLALASITNEAGGSTLGAVDANDYTKLDEIRAGWALGGGVEFAFQRNWTMKVEYLYMDFGKDTSTNASGDQFSHDNSLHTLKVGLNYRLQQPREQLK